ncbi:MAG: FtsX-like permease family protein [Thaumarchaeota archaeon]|nr:FtsX-like permease family protein [Nitrososphaerota archaeon]
MDYRARIGYRFIVSEKASLITGAVSIAIALLVLQVSMVNLIGAYNGTYKDLVDYTYGNVYITSQKGFIIKNDFVLVNWLDRLPFVDGAAPRLVVTGTVNATINGQVINDYNVPIVGIKPIYDMQASTVYKTIDGQFVTSKNDIVLGSIVQKDLGYPNLGDTVQIEVLDSHGKFVLKRLTIIGISKTQGARGLDNSVIMHIDTLRELLQRQHQSQAIIVRLNDPSKEDDVKTLFLRAFPSKADQFRAQTVEEAAEAPIEAFGANISLTYIIAHFGILSPAPVIVLVTFKQIAIKRNDIGILRALGAINKDIYLIFIFQAMVIGALGIGMGDSLGLVYTVIAKEIHLTYNGSIPLDVQFNLWELLMDDLMIFVVTIFVSLNPTKKALKIRTIDVLDSFIDEKRHLGIDTPKR